MNRARWERVQEIYRRARDLPEESQLAFLRSECQGDAELLRELKELLASQPPTDYFEPPEDVSELFGYGLVGRRIDDFRILKEIGRGGGGVVFLAEQISTGREVALKILPAVRSDERTLARFRREIRSAAKLEHPHAVPIFTSGEADGLAWYAMSYVDGHDLHTELRLQRGPARQDGALLPPFGSREYLAAVATLCADLADAIQAAHNQGIVHRDVKPGNILIDRSGKAKLSDFGIARDERFGTITDHDAVQGTLHYMSPEQARSLDAKVDERTDIYSLCVVLYEMLTLQPAFSGATSHEIITKIAKDPARPVRRCNPGVARDLATICEKGMSKMPWHRYSTASELADDLRRFLSFQSIKARPPGLGRRLADELRRRRAEVLVAGGVAAALIAGLVISDQRAVIAALRSDRDLFTSALLLEEWTNLDALAPTRERLLEVLKDGAGDLQEEAKALAERFEEDRIRRIERIQDLRQQAMEAADGSTDGPIIELLLRALYDAQAAAALYPEDAELRQLADPRLIYPRVDVRLADEVAAQWGAGAGAVFLRTADPMTERFGEAEFLGNTPLTDIPLPPGTSRVVVVIDGYGTAELTRSLEMFAQPSELIAHVRPLEDLTAAMIAIPAGEITHRNGETFGGLPEGSTSRFDRFHIDATEVSNGEFLAYLEATGVEPPRLWTTLGYQTSWRDLPVGGAGEAWLRFPISGITYEEAQGFAEWSGKRLPTRIELARAQRGTAQVFYPWENTPQAEAGQANIYGPKGDVSHDLHESFRVYLESVAPVDDRAYEQSPEGLYHAFGNVMEFSETPWLRERGGVRRIEVWQRLALGGAWDAEARQGTLATLSLRDASSTSRSLRTGFRCAITSPP